jgi:PPOX class probable F420-dependent enzyme
MMETKQRSCSMGETATSRGSRDLSPVPLPLSHRALLDGEACIALTTIMPDGQPQMTPIWGNREGNCVLLNTMRGFRKERNMRANSKVTLLAYDPTNPLHHLEIRGTVVDMTEEGALEHLDRLTQVYLHKPGARFFGECVPTSLQASYTPVKVTVVPTRVRVEG